MTSRISHPGSSDDSFGLRRRGEGVAAARSAEGPHGQVVEAQVAAVRAAEGTTRQRLLDAAMELFHANGYHATGIAAILKRAEVNSGSLYYFFPTKEDLLLALLERYKEMLYPCVLKPVFDRVSDPIERIFGVLEGYRQMLDMTNCSLG